ncbi:Olfactory Receptor 7G3 [Manis pentadactyla]|nr:Olfactory Receptor 7G3 [Manis pentadactyla]
MYFFLCNLSFVDICFTSTTTPKMLVNIKTQNKSISYTGCLTQICFVLTFVGLENEILMMMAFDRFVAICHPLRAYSDAATETRRRDVTSRAPRVTCTAEKSLPSSLLHDLFHSIPCSIPWNKPHPVPFTKHIRCS